MEYPIKQGQACEEGDNNLVEQVHVSVPTQDHGLSLARGLAKVPGEA